MLSGIPHDGTEPSHEGRLAQSIDLNCDMGEGMDTDTAIFPYISPANIACRYHAGDMDRMHRTVEMAKKEADRQELRFISEVFADKTYRPGAGP